MIRHLTRIPGFRRLWSKFPVGSVELRTKYDIWERPSYAFGIYRAATLARKLDFKSISVIEFGVAGGNGLLSMEHIAKNVRDYLDVNISVFGFDSGEGMPPPKDYRDLPHIWQKGFYEMDVDRLKARLQHAKLILGDISDTIPDFLDKRDLAPIAFVAFDLDYYSSTKTAFNIFSGCPKTRLPRIYCYFDDIIIPERACYNEFVGELSAIREFNLANDSQKICKIPSLTWLRQHPAIWNEMMYVFHDFNHSLYTRLITSPGETHRQLRLKPER